MKRMLTTILLVLLCAPVLAQKQTKEEKQKAIEMTFAADPSAIRAEIIKASAHEGWVLCDESASQVVTCESKWHDRVFTRFRFRRRFTLAGSTVVALTENCVETNGPIGPKVTIVPLDDKKQRAALTKLLDAVKDGLK